MANSFELLESRLLHEIYHLKNMLLSLHPTGFKNANEYINTFAKQTKFSYATHEIYTPPLPVAQRNSQYYAYANQPQQPSPTIVPQPQLQPQPTAQILSQKPALIQPLANKTPITSTTSPPPAVKALTTERIIEFKPMQTKSLKRILKPSKM